MPLILRYMHPNDVPQVVLLDQVSFPDPWSYRSYMFEINESKVSHMIVLEEVGTLAPMVAPRRSFFDWLMRRHPQAPPAINGTIVSYGGLWNIEEEAHISTIASQPQLRGRGYGEIALVGMVMKALALRAEYIILEVRVSNRVAQSLYEKYGFTTVNTQRKYYQDGEDAFLMRLDLTESAQAHVRTLYAHLQKRVPFEDRYSTVKHPRLG
jgi:ribosomal-protein-alanine N-acetyltransferase